MLNDLRNIALITFVRQIMKFAEFPEFKNVYNTRYITQHKKHNRSEEFLEVFTSEAATEGAQASVDALKLLSGGWCLTIEIVIVFGNI